MENIPVSIGAEEVLILTRNYFSESAVQGSLSFAATTHSTKTVLTADLETLERAWRNNEVGKSCIPPGIYPLLYRDWGTFYDRYNAAWEHDFVVEIGNVPGRSAILFHVGNTESDSEGCILVGDTRGVNSIGNSRKGYQEFYRNMAEAKPDYIIITQPEIIHSN